MTIECFTFLDILEAREENDRAKLNEASLGRIWQHISGDSKKKFAILTSWRVANPLRTNLKNQKELLDIIRSAGLGYFKLKGHWRECQDPNMDYTKCPPEMMRDTTEESFFIPDITEKLTKQLMSRFQQDAVIYAGPETDGKIALLFSDGTKQEIGNFQPGKVAQAYSSVKGKDFAFEYVAQNFGEVMVERFFKKT